MVTKALIGTEDRETAAPAFDRRAIPVAARESQWQAPDGWAIRRIDWPGAAQPPGSILFMPGRADCYEKYLDSLDHWHRQGWRVTSADWRGQAGSGRIGRRHDVGHISDFAPWVDDIAAFFAQWVAATPAPHVLMGHSMGGHLVLRALAERRVAPAAMVLSAPMLGLRGGYIPQWFGRWLFRLMTRLADPARPAWRINEAPGQAELERPHLLSHDPARAGDEAFWWAARPALKMGPASIGWVSAALTSSAWLARPGVLESVTTPLLIVATTADRLVDTGRIIRDAARLPQAQLRLWGEEAAHELLREAEPLRGEVIAAIDAFLAQRIADKGRSALP